MRTGASHTGFYWGLPFVYPIVALFSPREQEQLCAEASSLFHTFGRMEVSMRIMALIILRVEPRALSHPAAHPGCHQCSTDGQRSVQWCTWEDGVYHGVYTRGIPGRVPLSHTRVYQEEYHSPYPGIPQGVHPSPGYTTGCTSLTWLYLRVYTTMGVPLRVYTTMGVPLMCATLLGVPQVCYTVGCTSGCAPKVGIPRGVLLRWVYHGV